MTPTNAPDFSALPAGLADGAARHWADFRKAGGVLEDGPWRVELPRVWACSEFAARACVREPALLEALVRQGALQQPDSPGDLAARVTEALIGIADEESLMAALRRLRRREMLRLCWRDLAGHGSLEEVMAGLSELADACLDGALRVLDALARARVGAPQVGGALVVFGLGKLGGGELNFSSDVDLIFAFPEDGQTGGVRPLSHQEYFTHLGRRLIHVLNATTADGFVFRVDMRLRPNGDSGPLVLSFDATEHYYQAHGRDWERYALIKARPVAGDRQAGAALLERLRPFVYRRYLDFNAIEALREMKARIDRELERRDVRDNIKIGRGGIREIEFIVQAHQLIRGGRDRQLRSRALHPALAALEELGLLEPQQASELRDAYRFLRTTEHRLQMVGDTQVHTLPGEDTARLRLAYGMGFAGWGQFSTALSGHTDAVHRQFHRLFGQRRRTADPLAILWRDIDAVEPALQALAAAGFDDAPGAREILHRLRHSPAWRALSARGRERMDRLVPRVLAQLRETQQAATALARVVAVLEAISRRTTYLALLVENPDALSQLVRLCTASAWIANQLARHPILLDELLHPALWARPAESQEVGRALRSASRQADPDLGEQMEVLREFRHARVLRVAARDLAGATDAPGVGRELCVIAEAVLEQAVAVAWRDLVARFGCPQGIGDGSRGFAVIGYGKLGSREMGYTSDLDMLFLYPDGAEQGQTRGPRRLPNVQFYTRLGQRLLHILTVRTPAGALYEVDMRLRPSGQSGPLVTSIRAFIRYQQDKAWTWEHQALVRARAVAGDAALRTAFASARDAVLRQRRAAGALRGQVCEMRERMRTAHDDSTGAQWNLKHGVGGIVDIEFMVQYVVLRWAAEVPGLTRYTDNIHILAELGENGILDRARARRLAEIFRSYLSVEHRLKLTESPPRVAASRYAEERAQVTALWRELLE